MRYDVVSRFALLLAAGLLAVGLSSCSQQQDDASVSSIDSTLAMGDFSDDMPETDLTPGEEFSPPPEPAPAPKQSPPPAPAPKPKPKPAPPATATVPTGTSLTLALTTPLTTKTAQVGDPFTAVVSTPVIIGNRVAIPEGTVVYGHVAATQQPGKLSGRGMMQLAYDNLEFDGRRYNVASVGDSIWGKGGAAKDAGMVAGGAAVGAIVGKILGGSASKGAVVGGAAGAGATMLTRGPQLELAEGQEIVFVLQKQVTVTLPKLGA